MLMVTTALACFATQARRDDPHPTEENVNDRCYLHPDAPPGGALVSGDRDPFEIVKQAVASSSMSEDDKRHVIASSWTFSELPEITSQEEYESYKKIVEEITRQLPDWGNAQDVDVMTRSREGMRATAYVARMIEWEEREGK